MRDDSELQSPQRFNCWADLLWAISFWLSLGVVAGTVASLAMR